MMRVSSNFVADVRARCRAAIEHVKAGLGGMRPVVDVVADADGVSALRAELTAEEFAAVEVTSPEEDSRHQWQALARALRDSR